jgi:hypothetical protein
VTIQDIMAMQDLSEDVAKALAASGWWAMCSPREAALLQLRQPRLCLPNGGKLRELLSKALGRTVDGPEMNWIPKDQWIRELEAL